MSRRSAKVGTRRVCVGARRVEVIGGVPFGLAVLRRLIMGRIKCDEAAHAREAVVHFVDEISADLEVLELRDCGIARTFENADDLARRAFVFLRVTDEEVPRR